LRKLFTPAILCCALVLVLALSAHTAPSFRGYTGLVIIPTADALQEGEYNLGANTENIDDFNASNIFANFAPINNLEVGFDSFQLTDGADRETLLNAKYLFMPETDNQAGVAFGLHDLTNEVNSTAYAVASKSIARGLSVFDSEITNVRGHIGVGGGRFDGLFFGASAFLGNRLMLSFEYDSADVNLGARFTPVRGIRIHGGWFDVGGRDDFGLGVSYNKSY